MSNIDELERLQNLKLKGALSEQEFEIEKAKILNNDVNSQLKNNKWGNLKKDLLFIILIPVVIVTIGSIVNFIFSNNQNRNNLSRGNYYITQETNTNIATNTIENNKINNTNTDTAVKSEKNTSLIGKHKIIYLSGTDIKNITGYLELNSDNSFKMYASFESLNMELINIEGDYSISGNTISININREGGYDLGSQARKDIITIAEDNLAYETYKFAK